MPTPDDLFAELDDRFFLVVSGGSARVGVEKSASGEVYHPPKLWPVETFHTMNRHLILKHKVQVNADEPDEEPIYKISKRQATLAWLERDQTRRYEEIMLDPTNSAGPEVYNLWKGFSVRPAQGDWSLFQRLIHEDFCRGDAHLSDYLFKWMAFAVQHPERQAEVSVVLRGIKGVGKGCFGKFLGRLFGPNYTAIAQRGQLTGRFNAHMEGCIVMFVDEGYWAGDREAEGVLKSLITEPTIAIEQKNVDVKNVPNRLHLIISSNEDWVVPARGMERRFFVLDLATHNAQKKAVFDPLHAQMEREGGDAAMLYDLLRMDISDFDIRRAPGTLALREQMVSSFPPLEAWWFERLQEGTLMHRSGKSWGEIGTDTLYDSYRKNIMGHVLTKQQFRQSLDKLVPGGIGKVRQKVTVGEHVTRTYVYKFPSLAACRDHWDRIHNMPFDWDQIEEDEDEQD